MGLPGPWEDRTQHQSWGSGCQFGGKENMLHPKLNGRKGKILGVNNRLPSQGSCIIWRQAAQEQDREQFSVLQP